MREEAERKAFQQAVDRRLSALTGDPRLAQRIRAQAQTEGEPKMKKKLSFALVAALALALISAVALAAANWASIREFLGQEGTVARMDIVEDAIVKPTILQYDGKTLDIQANEAYWSAEGLSLTFHVTAREKDKMVVYYGGEIEPDEALAAGAAVVGTGRSDHPNQINNVLAFPGLFRGALDVRARDINEAMKQAASHALADLVSPEELSDKYILPLAFDKRVGSAVAEAVAQAARDSGVARL